MNNFFKFFFKQDSDFEKESKRNQFIDYLVALVEQGKCSAESIAEEVNQLKEKAPNRSSKVWLGNLSKGILSIEEGRN